MKVDIVKTKSERYFLDNAEIFERIINGDVFAIEINPSENYGLKFTDGESEQYSIGYMLIPADRADEVIANLSAVPVDEIPEPIEEPAPEIPEEVDDATALSELLEVIDDEA